MVYRRGHVLPISLILVLLLALVAGPMLAPSVRAAEPRVDGANVALDWLRTKQEPDGGFSAFGGGSDASVTADAIFAFVSGGIHPNTVVSAADATPLTYLHASAAAEAAVPGRAAKIAMALAISGDDPRDANGTDLIAAIEQGFNTETGWYGVSFYGHTFAVLALASLGASVADEAVDALLTAQTPDGSWGFNGEPIAGTGDSNTTAMAIQALVAAGGDQAAIEAGLDYLRSLQNPETGAIAYDSYSVGDSGGDANSTALAIQAFIAASEDPAALEHGDLLAALLTFQNASGAFQFQPSFPDDSLLATAQAVPALLLQAFPLEPIDDIPPVNDALADAAAPAAPLADCVFYDVTQHNVCEPFAAYWDANGGLANFGYPLTERVTWQGRDVQFFERAIFELHPENAGTPYEVLLTRVGADSYGEPVGAAPIGGECIYFEESGHNLCGGFAASWNAFGGLAVFGYPISEEFQEDGMTVQYFERARFEWHPGDWPVRYDVLLGRLAAEVLDRELQR